MRQKFPSRQALKRHQRKVGHEPKANKKDGYKPLALYAAAGLVALLLVVGAGLWLLERPKSEAVSSGQPAAVGQIAPDIEFTTTDGATFRLADFQGRPVMLWLIATWCPTCRVSAQALAERIDELERLGLQIITLKLYNNLGYPGPTIEEFARRWANVAYDSPNWLWGDASQQASFSYDPKGYPDIYWLIDREGIVRAVDTAPNATMERILSFARSP